MIQSAPTVLKTQRHPAPLAELVDAAAGLLLLGMREEEEEASSGSKRSDESSGRHESKRGAKASRLRRMVSNPTRELVQRRTRIGNMWTGGHPAQSAAEIHDNRSRFCAKANFTRSLTLKQGMRVQHRSWRHRLKLFIDEPQSSICAKYTWVILMLAVVASIAVLCVQTLDVDGARHDCTTVKALKTIETVCNCAFSLEVVIRIVAYSTDYDSFRQLTREPIFYVDVLGVLPFYIQLISYAIPGSDEYGKSLLDCEQKEADIGHSYRSILMLLRLLRGLRLLKLVRHFPGWRVLILALKRCWEALLVPAFFLIICVFMMAGLVYVAENCCNDGGEPSLDFPNMFQSIWFVLVTFTTVGYGDISPNTAQGKLVAAGAILLGILFTAMPITIMGQSFADAWEEKETIQIGLKLQEYLIRRGEDPYQIMDIFKAFDKGGNESLDFDEFREALKVLGWNAEGRQITKLFNMFDIDGDGQVDYAEFCAAIFPGGILSKAVSQRSNSSRREDHSSKRQNSPRRRCSKCTTCKFITASEPEIFKLNEDAASLPDNVTLQPAQQSQPSCTAEIAKNDKLEVRSLVKRLSITGRMNNARKVEPEQPAQQSQSSCTAEKAKESKLKFHSIVRCLSTVGRMSNAAKVEPEPEDEMSKIEERALMRQQAHERSKELESRKRLVIPNILGGSEQKMIQEIHQLSCKVTSIENLLRAPTRTKMALPLSPVNNETSEQRHVSMESSFAYAATLKSVEAHVARMDDTMTGQKEHLCAQVVELEESLSKRLNAMESQLTSLVKELSNRDDGDR